MESKELGTFKFSYKTKGEVKSLECAITLEEPAATNDRNHQRWMGTKILKLHDASGQFIGGYGVMNGVMQFMSTYEPFYKKYSVQYKFEKEFRRELPEILNRAGLLDEKGELISDGDEAFRYVYYRYDYTKREKFVMPENPYTYGNDKDNPLTWRATPYRVKGLRVAFVLFHYQLGADDDRRTKTQRKYDQKRVDEL